MRKFLSILLLFLVVFSSFFGCSPNAAPDFKESAGSSLGTEEFNEGFDGPFAHQPFFCYNGVLYVMSPSLGNVYTELPEGYSYVGETVNVGTIFGLKEMESNVSGSIYKNDSTSDYAIISFPGDGYDDGLARYILCIPCED